MEKVWIGKVVNTFGIKGELKVFSDFEMAAQVFQKGNQILINNEFHEITNIRYHKNHYLVEIDQLANINLVLKYKGSNLYIERSALALSTDEYLLADLVGLSVYDGQELIGVVSEVINNTNNPLLKVDNEFYIPLKANYINKVDLANKTIIGQNIKELKL